MDRKLVFLVSNFHNRKSFQIIQRKEKDDGKSLVKCPTSIVEYNKYMGGVDLANQRKASYSLDRKSRRFWLCIFFNFLNITLSNAFVVFRDRTDNNPGRRIPFSNFLESHWIRLKKRWINTKNDEIQLKNPQIPCRKVVSRKTMEFCRIGSYGL